MDHLSDPRWEGQDSQSLPDRPAHPDPSKRAEFGDPEKTPSHGIYGHLEAKHGLISDKELDRGPAPGRARSSRRRSPRASRSRRSSRRRPTRRVTASAMTVSR
jgi:hypothetical protein